jgi:hypothetical protein
MSSRLVKDEGHANVTAIPLFVRANATTSSSDSSSRPGARHACMTARLAGWFFMNAKAFMKNPD